jgi:hypothetical protein
MLGASQALPPKSSRHWFATGVLVVMVMPSTQRDKAAHAVLFYRLVS